MPRTTRQSRTQVDTGSVAPARPTVAPAPVVPRQTPVIGSEFAGLEGLSTAFSNFFGGALKATATLQETELLVRKAEIERENQLQQAEAMKLAVTGQELTPDQQLDLDYALAYNRTKADAAAAADAFDFQTNVLPGLALEDNPQEALQNYVGEKVRGATNVDYAGFYAESMMKLNLDAVQKHRADLFIQNQKALQDDFTSTVNSMIQLERINGVDDLNRVIAEGSSLFGAAGTRQGEQWAVQKVLNLAALNGQLDKITPILEQPVEATPDNPNGLSWAARFPDAYESLHQDARKVTSARYQKDVSDRMFQVDRALADGNLTAAAQGLLTFVDTYGDTDEDYRKREIAFRKLLSSEADTRAATDQLMTAKIGQPAPPPEAVNKYGNEILQKLLGEGGPLVVADRLAVWGSVPNDFQNYLQVQLTRNADPKTAAEFYDKVAAPLLANAPAQLYDGLSDDAKFVVDYVADEQLVSNRNTLDAMSEAHNALQVVRKGDLKQEDFLPWNPDEKGAKAKFFDDLKSDIEDALDGDELSPVFLRSSIWPSVQRRIMMYSATGLSMEDATDRAVEAVTKSLESQVSVLPNANGDTYITGDVSPDVTFDGKRVTKWRPTVLPDGETVDPNEMFREQSQLPKVRFLGNGEDLGLAVGQDTQIDGAYDVRDVNNMPIFLRPGQSWTFDGDSSGLSLAELRSGKRAPEQTVTLPEDEEMFVAEMNDAFEGTGFRISRWHDQDMWVVQYKFEPPAPPTLEDLERKKYGENLKAQLDTPDRSGLKGYVDDIKAQIKSGLTDAAPEGLQPAVDAATSAIKESLTQVAPEGLQPATEAAKAAIKATLTDASPDGLQPAVDAAKAAVAEVAKKFANAAPDGLQPAVDTAKAAVEGVAKEFARQATEAAPDGLTPQVNYLRNLAREMISGLQDKGLLPQSLGVTKVLPDFADAEQVWDYIRSESLRFKMASGNIPLEPGDAPTGGRYVTARRDFLILNEGIRQKVYKDTKGIATAGIGFNLTDPAIAKMLTSVGIDVPAVKAGKKTLSDAEIDAAFEVIITEAERIVSNKIKVPLTANQRLALVSLVYNGPVLLTNKLVNAVNEGRWSDAATIIRKGLNKGAHRGIQNRREREADLFLRGGTMVKITP